MTDLPTALGCLKKVCCLNVALLFEGSLVVWGGGQECCCLNGALLYESSLAVRREPRRGSFAVRWEPLSHCLKGAIVWGELCCSKGAGEPRCLKSALLFECSPNIWREPRYSNGTSLSKGRLLSKGSLAVERELRCWKGNRCLEDGSCMRLSSVSIEANSLHDSQNKHQFISVLDNSKKNLEGTILCFMLHGMSE